MIPTGREYSKGLPIADSHTSGGAGNESALAREAPLPRADRVHDEVAIDDGGSARYRQISSVASTPIRVPLPYTHTADRTVPTLETESAESA